MLPKLNSRSLQSTERAKGKPVGPMRFFGAENDELVPRKLLHGIRALTNPNGAAIDPDRLEAEIGAGFAGAI